MIILPYPPSANSMYRSIGRGRVIMSEEGRNYLNGMLRLFANYRKASANMHRFGDARLAVVYKVYPPDNRARDLGNLDKCLSDCLTKCAVWNDDSQIDDLRLIRMNVVQNGMIEAIISTILIQKTNPVS